jgi:hypothetical protein
MKNTAAFTDCIDILDQGVNVGLIKEKTYQKFIARMSNASERDLTSDEVEELNAALDQARKMIANAQQKQQVRLAEENTRNNDDVELREEVIEALVAEGFSRPVAANKTNTLQKMLAEGKRLGVI